ncbi:hypothetical protein [Ancylobacter mangrovi]|uniref:hypothetical protein n=1 Tax=Ancylobacter mangrovi TaxID=2972472 RepID=UPI002162018E|nr:hypothetical protein [Ancylobacter mangrovi]MCS0501599.1 hypothetical protein [Ancylobacter mangrovi]
MSRVVDGLWVAAAADGFGTVDSDEEFLIEGIVRTLLDRPSQNHVPLAHPALADAVASDAERAASVYVFDASAVHVAESIMAKAERSASMWGLFRPPADLSLFDFPHPFGDGEFGRVGVLVKKADGPNEVQLDIITLFKGRVRACAVLDVGPSQSGSGFDLTYTWAAEWLNSMSADDAEGVLNWFAGIVVGLSIFLSIGGATVSERRPLRRVQSRIARRLPAAPCVYSFNSVRLNFPNGGIGRNRRVTFEGRTGVRRHEVRTHLREITLKSGDRVLRWIAAHWRGNARLGVVVKERNVTTRSAKGPA